MGHFFRTGNGSGFERVVIGVRNNIKHLAAVAATAATAHTSAACDGVDTVTESAVDQPQQPARNWKDG
jgi:hypothetical protein